MYDVGLVTGLFHAQLHGPSNAFYLSTAEKSEKQHARPWSKFRFSIWLHTLYSELALNWCWSLGTNKTSTLPRTEVTAERISVSWKREGESNVSSCLHFDLSIIIHTTFPHLS